MMALIKDLRLVIDRQSCINENMTLEKNSRSGKDYMCLQINQLIIKQIIVENINENINTFGLHKEGLIIGNLTIQHIIPKWMK